MTSPGLCPSRPAQAPARSHQHSLIVLSHIHQPFVHLPTYPSVHQPVTLWAHPWAGQMLLFMGESRPWRGALQPEASSAGPRRLLPSPAGSSCEPVSLSVPPPQQNLHTMLQSSLFHSFVSRAGLGSLSTQVQDRGVSVQICWVRALRLRHSQGGGSKHGRRHGYLCGSFLFCFPLPARLTLEESHAVNKGCGVRWGLE